MAQYVKRKKEPTLSAILEKTYLEVKDNTKKLYLSAIPKLMYTAE